MITMSMMSKAKQISKEMNRYGSVIIGRANLIKMGQNQQGWIAETKIIYSGNIELNATRAYGVANYDG